MFKRFVKFIIGVALLPVCYGMSIGLFRQLAAVRAIERVGWFFLCGVLTYAGMYAYSVKMRSLYVFGHESVHAVCTWLCGGKVKSFKASGQGGSVIADKVNTLISLGPYVVPFYTVFLAAIFGLAGKFIPGQDRYSGLFMYLLGLSTAFHLLMTVDSLRIEQPDLARNGYFFSFVVMYGGNLCVIAALISVVFAEAGFVRFARDSAAGAWQLYRLIAAVFPGTL